MSHYNNNSNSNNNSTSNNWQNRPTYIHDATSNAINNNSISNSSALSTNLLAQFAANSVNLSSLTAQIPNLASLNMLNLKPAANYQWQTSSNNTSNNNSNGNKVANQPTGQNRNNPAQSKGQSQGLPSLMDIDTIAKNSGAPKPVPPPSSLPSIQQNQMNRNQRNGANASSQNNNNTNSNNKYGNNTNTNRTSPNIAAQTNNAPTPTPLLTANPLAQVLLNQLASSGAVAAALAAVQQQQQNQNAVNINKSVRSRSPSIASSYTNNNSSSSTNNKIPKNNSSNQSRNHEKRETRSPSPHSKNRSANSTTHKYTNSSSSSSSTRSSMRLPKYSLDIVTNNVVSIKNKHSELYIPSDFSNSKNGWMSSLPINRPLKFNSRCLFHVMKKEAQPFIANTSIYDPPDADHTWTVKVMLLAMPSMNELIKRCCSLAEDNWKEDRYEHPSKVIQFLVGSKGKHELMALGGPWSPSLDGPDPATNKQTLINTAIRTVKALTGLDLSPCTQWFRFLDIQYNRNEEYKTTKVVNHSTASTYLSNSNNSTVSDQTTSEKSESAASEKEMIDFDDDSEIESTIIFLPNVWSLMPNTIEYQKLVELYKNYVENPSEFHQSNANSAKQSTSTKPSDSSEVVKKEPVNAENETMEPQSNTKPTDDANLKCELNENSESIDQNNITINTLIQSASSTTSDEKPEPTHYSKLDLKKLRVDDLRAELMARNLDTKGLKAQLLTRLKEAVEIEKSNDGVVNLNESQSDISLSETNNNSVSDEIADNQKTNEDTNIEKKETNGEEKNKGENPNEKRIEEINKMSKQERERLYRLPSAPHIIIHPSATAKNNKFECQLVSLSHLLNYRKEDNKESSFEVSLFAECFNDMLIRDFGLLIYKHILALPIEHSKSSNAESNSNKRKLNPQDLKEADNEDGKHESTTESKKLKTSDGSSSNESNQKTDSDSGSKVKHDQTGTKSKPKTFYPELLLAFTYLDVNRTNNVYERELEELITLIGLNLTRSKCRFLLNKLNFKDKQINYRSLTDKTASSTNQLTGFILPGDEELVKHICTVDDYLKRKLNESNENLNKNEASNETSIVEINGVTIDVVNTIKKLEASESNERILDQKLKDSLNEIDRLQIINKNAERQKQKLNDELIDCKKKMREQQRSNKDIDDKYLRYKDCIYKVKSQLNKVLDDIGDTVKRNSPSSSNTNNSTQNANPTKSNESSVESNESETKQSNGTVIESNEINQKTADIKEEENEEAM